MTYPPDRYSDLREEKPNPDIERLVAQLDAVGQQFKRARMSPAQNQKIANLLYQQAAAHPTSSSHTWRHGAWSVRRAVVGGIGALAIVVALSGATLAIGGAVGITFPWNYSVLQTPRGQQVNLARSACGYTLRLRSVYADANVVILGYTAFAPDGKPVEAGLQTPVVTDMTGAMLPESDYSGVTDAGALVQYQSFDTGGILGRPSSLTLHLVVPSLTLLSRASATPACAGPTPVVQPTQSPMPVVSPSPTAASAAAGAEEATGPGPYVFDLTVTYHSGRQLQPHLVATESGRSLTLERVVSTPLETRFYVGGSALNAYPILTADGHTLNAGSWGPDATDGSLIVYNFAGSLFSEHGQWTLSIHTQNSIGALPGEQQLPTGVWTFKFTLP